APSNAAEEKAPSPQPVLPAGTVGRAEKPAGILLRENKESKGWDQLTAETPLRDQDQLLNLAKFRSPVDLGGSKVQLVDETVVAVPQHQPAQPGRISLGKGRVVLHGTNPPKPYVIQFGKKSLEITPAAGMAVGLERVSAREPGAKTASEANLLIYATEG